MLFETRAVATSSKSSSNNREDAVRTRHRHRARPATICNRRARGLFLFAATASLRKDSRSLSFSCWQFRNAGPRASPPRRRATPAFRARSRSTRSSLPSPLRLLKLSRSFLRASVRCLLYILTNNDIAAVRAPHRPANQNYFLGFTHLHHLEVLHRHPFVAHVTRHAHVLPDATRRGTIADGAVSAMRLRSVGRALAVEIVFFHHALEPFALRAADDVNPVARLKLRDAQIDFAFGRIRPQPKFLHQLLRLGTGCLEFAQQCLGHARFLLRIEPDFYCRITVILRRHPANQNVIAGRDHGHRTHPTIRVVNAGHADLLS